MSQPNYTILKLPSKKKKKMQKGKKKATKKQNKTEKTQIGLSEKKK